MIKRISKKLSSLKSLLYVKLREKTFEKQLKYLFFSNQSDTLLIVFSAFDSDNRRRYNYVKGLYGCSYDRLYILDPWGYKGSYNMYENGSDYPMKVANRLINKYIDGWGISG